MINLGPYSGKNCPNVRFQPTVLDRILEGTALLIVLVTWISISGDEHHSVVSAFGQCLGLVLCIRQTPAPCLVCFVGGGIYRVLYTGV